MAVAFFIPDEAYLLRKARQKEQQILALREAHWRYVVSVLYESLIKYIEASRTLLRRSKNSKKFPTTKK